MNYPPGYSHTHAISSPAASISFRDNYYRSLCDNPTQYDKVVDWIIANNPAAKNNSFNQTPEEFACFAVHYCIRTVVFGSIRPSYVGTGMCLAVRASSNPDSLNYEKVVLAIQL